MRVLQILPALETGGVETGTVDLAKELIRQNHRAVVVSAGGSLVSELISLGVKHYQLPVNKKSPLTILRMSGLLAGIIKKEKIDVVHARSRVPAWIACLACYRTGCSFVTTCHGYYNTHFTSRVMGWGKRVIVVSRAIGRHMIDDFKVPPERVRHIARGVDLEKFTFNPGSLKRTGAFKVGIIGRITPLKGHKYFLKAISKVVRQLPRIRAQIIGEAAPGKIGCKEELLVSIRQLGITNYVEFLGRRSDIPAVLSGLDVLVMATTAQEAFGRVLIEAGAVGIPVIATRVGGVVEIIEDGKNGILVPARDSEAIAGALLKIYRDRQLAESFIKRAREKVERLYDLKEMYNKTIKVYQEAIGSLKILVIKFSAAGDVILIVPSLRSLRAKFPGAYISVIVDMEVKDILKNCPYVDEVLAYDIKGAALVSKDIINIARSLRRESFDMVIDLQNNSKSHLLGFLSASAKRYGYKNKKLGFLLKYGIKDTGRLVDPIKHQERVLNLLGVDIVDKSLKLWPADEDERYIEEFLKSEWVAKGQPLVGLNITASKRWQSKRWPLENFAKLSNELTLKHNLRIVVTGGSEDKEEAERFAALTKSKPIIACGKTSFMQLAALIKRCRVIVTSDSAPMHVAAALKVPFVALFGPTDPKRHVASADKCTVIYKRPKCGPCYKPKCDIMKCMKSIGVEEVAKAVIKWINAK
ncbi:MAG: lipopolysaccharide heptosyltransferase II [Candidatus Omnitrophica bacterium]|nr:lipopolysaccharide heptosyltransferase II [Candidatus Omnitrophota bacterium]